MIRASYIFLMSFAMAFLFQTNAKDLMADGTVDMADMEQSSATNDNTDYITQDNSPSLFVYWDERVRTTLSEFRENNRQPTRNSLQLLRHQPPTYKSIIDLGDAGFSYAEYSPSVAENYIVTLRKFRI